MILGMYHIELTFFCLNWNYFIANRLLEHESCEKLQRDIMEQLSQRQSTKLSDKFASLSANIRVRLKQFYNEVTELKRKLNEADNSRSMYDN